MPPKSKTRTVFVCQQCGSTQLKWMGRCPDCGEWNSLVEVVESRPGGGKSAGRRDIPRSAPARLTEVQTDGHDRIPLAMQEFSRVLGGGIVPGCLVLVSGDPGIGKCVTGDTRVLDPVTGDYLPITAWQDARRSVLSIDDGSLRLGPAKVSAFQEQGRRSIVRVTTRLGRQLRCTASHPLLTAEGWMPVSRLRPGDRIASPRSLPFFGNQPMPEAEIKLIAYVLSEGSAQSAVTVTSALTEVAADLEEIADYFGMQLKRYLKPNTIAVQYRFTIAHTDRQEARVEMAQAIRRAQKQSGISWAEWARRAGVKYEMLNVWRRGRCAPAENELRALAEAIGYPVTELAPEARHRAEMSTPIARFLERHGIRYARAVDKAVPACMFRLPREQMALFLRTLFTGNGSIFVNRRGLAGLSYSTVSRRLAEDVQHLLLRFGLVTKLRTKHSRVNAAEYVSYEVAGVGARRTQAFISEIGILGRAPAQTALAGLAPQIASSQTDTVPTGEVFWAILEQATGGLSFRTLSEKAGVVVRNRRRERPLRRETVARLAKAFPDPHLESLGHGDVYWDEIVSIEPCGFEEVYDLTVPRGSNFVANDLVVHNSTLLTQVVAQMAATHGPVLYVSGEESAQQIKMRADRLGLSGDQLYLLTETDLDEILIHIERIKPRLAVIDSIQTVHVNELTSAAGSISQVRECAARLQELAKQTGTGVFLVGHVTKSGAIAGPKVLEHIVDTVLYLEGDRHHAYRLLRSTKNRFGATSEVGVFEMRGSGLVEVANPSEAFLAERLPTAPGSSIAVTMEGTRPLLVEVQALCSTSAFGLPRRTANGVDINRMLLIVAVLSKRLGLRLGDQDVFVNVIGGLHIGEPAADLSIAASIASSLRDSPVAADLALIGEIGLSGELRAVSQLAARLNEAAKLGFRRALIPKTYRVAEGLSEKIEIVTARSLSEALAIAMK